MKSKMEFIERELRHVKHSLRKAQSDEEYKQLYVAQQALSWALKPFGFASPHDVIMRGKVQPLIRDI